ncbi:hypothetical protein MMC25_008229 [Agyrium rufum]|nr:hypothetical protein [Agyrium rufum]
MPPKPKKQQQHAKPAFTAIKQAETPSTDKVGSSTSFSLSSIETPTSSTPSNPEPNVPQHNSPIPICPTGDILLQIPDVRISVAASSYLHTSINSYRVSSAVLRASSPYFRALLDPLGFSEGIRITETLAALRDEYSGDAGTIPDEKLPKIWIEDVGLTPTTTGNQATLERFFGILHSVLHESRSGKGMRFHGSSDNVVEGLQRTSNGDENLDSAAVRVRKPVNLTLLAIVADRFDAAAVIAIGLPEAGRILAMPTDKEEQIRQRILAGMLLGIDSVVLKFSAQIIVQGSVKWLGYSSSGSPAEANEEAEKPLWWSLPNGIEEELEARRTAILATVSYLQDYFLRLYSSPRVRQCKLGYDSSPQCDSFQLGEMIRFFVKHGTLRLSSLISSPEDLEEEEADSVGLEYRSRVPCEDVGQGFAYVININLLLTTLRQIPEYQVDQFHKHCGLRSRLRPALEFLTENLSQGICMQCWRSRKQQVSWLEITSQPHRARQAGGSRPKWNQADCEDHESAKKLFTRPERIWEYFDSGSRRDKEDGLPGAISKVAYEFGRMKILNV